MVQTDYCGSEDRESTLIYSLSLTEIENRPAVVLSIVIYRETDLC